MCKPEKAIGICKYIGIILGVTILTVIFLINFVVACVYRNQCPVQYWIWLYNIVAGSTGVFLIFSWILAAIFYQTCSRRLSWCFFLLGLFILVFEMIWIIASLIKIEPLWTNNIAQHKKPALNTYCQSTLYNLTQALLVTGIICVGLIVANIIIEVLQLTNAD
jgi:hypothetical protein